MSASSSSSELLFVKGSAECAHPACHLHDFLPIKCTYCKSPFCSSHFLPFSSSSTSSGHACASPPPDRTPIPCPLCAYPIGTPEGDDPNLTMDAHMGGKFCTERVTQIGREKEVLRSKKERGEVCFARGCKKTLLGGLGVRCTGCSHIYCTNHRFNTSHSCTPSTSRTPTPAAVPKGVRSILGGPSREAALAAIKRQSPSGAASSSNSATVAPASKVRDPTPLKPSEKDSNPNDGPLGKPKIKPLVNPLSATSR